MKHIRLSRLAIVLAVPAIAACASWRGGSSGGDLDLSNPAIVPPLNMREVRLLQGMTDPNILGHMAMSDSVEVVMAGMAEARTKDDDVLNFAREMDADHSANLSAERDLARTSGIGMHTMVGELRMGHMGTLVDSVGPQISEMTFNHNYIIANVQMHEHMLAELSTLQSVARDERIRDHIANTMTTVQDHLAKAHDIAVRRGWMTANSWRY